MAPEQIRDSTSVDARSDIWSLGIVLYELLTGRVPWHAFTVSGMLAQIAADPPRSPTEHRADLEPALVAVVLRCLEKDPGARPASVAALARELAPFATRGPEVADLVERTLHRAKAQPSDPPEPVAVHDPTLGATSVTAGEIPRKRVEEPLPSRRPRSVPATLVAAAGLIAAGGLYAWRSIPRATAPSPPAAAASYVPQNGAESAAIAPARSPTREDPAPTSEPTAAVPVPRPIATVDISGAHATPTPSRPGAPAARSQATAPAAAEKRAPVDDDFGPRK